MLIRKLKTVFFDKQKEETYNKPDEWALVRKMFPWIYKLDDKKSLTKLLAEQPKDIIKLLSTYYRSEVNELIAQKRYWDIIKYDWIQKLISDLNDLLINPNEYARGNENEWRGE